MNQQIKYRAGELQTYVATRSFDLGSSGLKALRGVEIQFDGSQVVIAGTAPVMLPTLRGAIRLGWLVPVASYDEDQPAPRPVSAGVTVRPAEGGNPMEPQEKALITTEHVASEEQTVTNVAAHAAATKANNLTNYRRDGAAVSVEDQGGVVVRQVSTPTNWKTDLKKTSVHAAIREAESVKVVAGQGRTREEMMDQMTASDRAQYEAEIASHKVALVPEEATKIVATLDKASRVVEREGVMVTQSIGGGTSIADMGGTGVAGPDQVTVTTQEGIRMVNTNGPGTVKKMQTQVSSAVVVQNDAQARQIAKAICPDFPENYVFTDPVRKKIARLQADFDDRPDVIKAVAAADVDPVVRGRLIQEFPQAFGSL